jgi:aspartate/glutamate racemase
MRLADVPRLEHDEEGDPALRGRILGLINGSAWIQLWSYYFGRRHLPGVKLVNVGNEAVQLNFMKAHREGKECPPQSNIRLFAEYAGQLAELAQVDAIMVTCSTMNRSIGAVRAAVPSIPVVQIDEPMMEAAVAEPGTVLVVATHGPTVESTKALLRETAARTGTAERVGYEGATVEDAFHLLGHGDIQGHNAAIAAAIRSAMKRTKIDRVVLAQLSMSVFLFDHPEPAESLGVPVLMSGEEGFKRMRSVLSGLPRRAQRQGEPHEKA